MITRNRAHDDRTGWWQPADDYPDVWVFVENPAQRPSWKPEEARSKVEAIYGNRTTLKRREIDGEIADDSDNMAFNIDKIKKLMAKPPLVAPYHINDNLIYVALDPNGGASATNAPGSDTAIVSFLISEGRIVVRSRAHRLLFFFGGGMRVCARVVHCCAATASRYLRKIHGMAAGL